jgi:hypothetical protein
MGAFLKYIIPICLISVGAVIFQNCGKSLQANGDPYEIHDGSSIQVDPILDPPSTSNDQAGASFPNFNPELSCSATSQTSHIFAVNLGKKGGQDSVVVQLRDGRYKIYPWPPSDTILVLNNVMTTDLKIETLQLISGQMNITINYQGTSSTEILSCQ